MTWWQWLLVAVVALLALVALYDLVQRKHAILRNFPVIGHLRFILEAIGPELRQYIVTDNDSDKPFSRDQRRWVYTSSKQANTYYGFGTDNDLEGSNHYLIIKQAPFPLDEPRRSDPDFDPNASMPMAKVLGAARGRRDAFRPASAVNISSMSFGSLSGRAVQSLNEGAARAGCWQGTGEGGITEYHRHGGDLVWQIGTGYFGCRDAEGNFELARFRDVVEAEPRILAVEIKLSQGAKPGIGGLLPGAKVTPEIARLRGIPVGVDCVSPASHRAFRDADSLLDFAELLAETSGKPVGIKSAVGDDTFFRDLARLMERGDRGVDYVNIDGGEGGTGAGPLVFTDHVALPFKVAFSRVYRAFAEAGITDRVVFIGAGKLGLPGQALLAFALGCDGVNVGREAMLSIGCIQAQRCHTDRCPTGVATQSKWRQRGLDPAGKSVRCANYIMQLRREILRVSRACGAPHPGLITTEQIEILDDHFGSRLARDVFAYEPGWGRPSVADSDAISELMP
jgi:glutamate synthase domain-containing protein 2